jgi:Na/Pi-cotransporter
VASGSADRRDHAFGAETKPVYAVFTTPRQTTRVTIFERGDDRVSWPTILLEVLGGLVLFLFGVFQLAEAIEPLATDRARHLLSRFTTNPFAAVLTGIVATTILDSSSVTIILVIALVNGRLLTFTQSLGVIMGSNIGTTVSSQIFAMDVEQYAPLVLLLGFLTFLTARRSAGRRHIGLAVLGLGLVFFGLRYIGEAVAPLRDHEGFMGFMTGLERPAVGVAVGALATVAIQSSSAMLGIVITLAGQGLLTLQAGLAVMLGAEIGTCADTLVASIAGGDPRGRVPPDLQCDLGGRRRPAHRPAGRVGRRFTGRRLAAAADRQRACDVQRAWRGCVPSVHCRDREADRAGDPRSSCRRTDRRGGLIRYQ